MTRDASIEPLLRLAAAALLTLFVLGAAGALLALQ
jgi:hypothetical protein